MNGKVAGLGALVFLVGLVFMLSAFSGGSAGDLAGYGSFFVVGFALELIGAVALAAGLKMRGKGA